MFVDIKCPHCRKIAQKRPVNPSAGHSTSHGTCQKCGKRIAIETDHGKVKVYKD